MNTLTATSLNGALFESCARVLEQSPDHRVLRRLSVDTSPMTRPLMFDDACILAVDVETTGVDPETCKIIEFAARPIIADGDGAVVEVGEPASWLEDPGVPLPPEIVALTGLSDADLAGRRIDDDAVMQLVAASAYVIAHNALFDRSFIDARFPNLPRRRWLCSFADLDWRGLGFEGRGLNALLMQQGLFQAADAHRAREDVDALVGLLRTPLRGGRTVVGELLRAGQEAKLWIEATGAHYEARNALKARGYRWNPACRVWGRELPCQRRDEELAWLSQHVYPSDLEPCATGPTIFVVGAFDRHLRRRS